MYVRRRIISAVTLILGLFLSSQAQADHTLNGNSLSSLMLDKTIRAKHLDHGYAFSIYFDKDGKTAYRKQGGGITRTTYTINNDRYCLRWNNQEQCLKVIDNHNGTYSHIDNKDQRIVEWVKLEQGQKFTIKAASRVENITEAKSCPSNTI